ncbi:Protein fam72a [Mortierella claussenii]|nr:Protein fam72a [Mortierella claussenii]
MVGIGDQEDADEDENDLDNDQDIYQWAYEEHTDRLVDNNEVWYANLNRRSLRGLQQHERISFSHDFPHYTALSYAPQDSSSRTGLRSGTLQDAFIEPQPRLHQRHPQEHLQHIQTDQTPSFQPQTNRLQQLPRYRHSAPEVSTRVVDERLPLRPAFLSQPVYQLACAACIRPLCLRAMKAVMLSDHSKELYSTDMPPVGLQLVNDDRQVRHCACRIRDSACLGCGQVAGYHVTQPCSDCLNDQNNGHFWMFYSSAVYHYKRNRIEVPMLSARISLPRLASNSDPTLSYDDCPMTACIEMDEWLNSPLAEVVCR